MESNEEILKSLTQQFDSLQEDMDLLKEKEAHRIKEKVNPRATRIRGVRNVFLPETQKYVDKTNCAHRPPASRTAERSWKHLEGDNKRPVVLVTVKDYGINFLSKPQQRVVPHTPEYHN